MTAPDIDEAVVEALGIVAEDDRYTAAGMKPIPGSRLAANADIARALLAQVAENKRLHASRDAEAKVVEAAVALYLDADETHAVFADEPEYSANRIKQDFAAVDDLIRLRAAKENSDAK